MHRIIITALLCALTAVSAFAADAQINQISAQDAKAWTCYTVPLPKQIDIKAEAIVPAGEANIYINAQVVHPIYDQIRKEFADTNHSCFGAKTAFLIKVEIGGNNAEPLKALKNSEQACRIIPSEDNKSLIIAALSPQGAYYGWTTVKQLINGRSSAETLKIPILTVTDWPDMERRGLWGSDSTYHFTWLTDRKMNHFEQINARGMDKDGVYYAHSKGLPDDFGEQCARHAAYWVPVVLHLEQVWQEDTMGKVHPEMKHKNATEPGALCYSEPETTKMIAEWIYILAQDSTNCEVDVWLTENMSKQYGCQCSGCIKEWHTVNEARVVVEAWEMAKKKLGKYITLYILTSEATEGYNTKIFSIIPKDVRVCYYHSLLTYNTLEKPMLRPYLSDYIKEGRWLGVCPNVDAWTHNNVPFTGAQFIKYRMDEYVTKGVSELLGYATPRVTYNRFNVEACAEWSWNANGRSTKDFAYSYAVRQGYSHPDTFAKWSETLGPVAWDVYGSNWPAGQRRGQGVKVKTALKEGKLPELGYTLWDCYTTPWGDIKSEKQLNDDVAAASKAVDLAREMGMPQVMYETLVIDGYIRTLKALYELKKITPNGKFVLDNKAEADMQARAFLTAANQVVTYLPKWEKCVGDKGNDQTGKPIEIMKEVAGDIKKIVNEMGLSIK